MSQRLIRKNTTPVGFVGREALFVLRGATPDGDSGENTGSEGQENSGAGTGENAGSEGQQAAGNGEQGQQPDESAEAFKARMQAADRRAAAAEARVKELERAALSEVEKKDRDLQELTTFKEQATAEISSLKARVAFLSTNDVTWHNPDVALGQIDLDAIRDENGEVDKAALKREIKRVSSEMPYLVKTSTGGESGGGAGGKGGSAPAGQSGGTPGSGQKKGDQGLSDEELRRRYPALYV